jgi:hypothetical protein
MSLWKRKAAPLAMQEGDGGVVCSARQITLLPTALRDKFHRTVVRLVLVSAACGILAGTRGGLFTVAMSR